MATLLEQAVQERDRRSLLQQAITERDSRFASREVLPGPGFPSGTPRNILPEEDELLNEQEITGILNDTPQFEAGEEPSFIGGLIDRAQSIISEKTGLFAPDIGFIDNIDRPQGVAENLSELKTELPSVLLRVLADRLSGLTLNTLDIVANKVDASILDSEAPVKTFGELVDKVVGLERRDDLDKAAEITGKIFNFTGRLKTIGKVIPAAAAAPLREALRLQLASTDEQIVKAITDDPTFEGGAAVQRDTALGLLFGLAESGTGAAWKFLRGLKPDQQAAALKTLKLKVGATEAEIRKAAQRMAIKFHPDKVAGKVEQFKKVIRARDVAIAAREGKVIQKVTRRGLQITGEAGKPAITPKPAPTRPPTIAKEKIPAIEKVQPSEGLEAKQEAVKVADTKIPTKTVVVTEKAITEPQKQAADLEKKIPEVEVDVKPGPAKTIEVLKAEAEKKADVNIAIVKEVKAPKAKQRKVTLGEDETPIKVSDFGNGLGLQGKNLVHIDPDGNALIVSRDFTKKESIRLMNFFTSKDLDFNVSHDEAVKLFEENTGEGKLAISLTEIAKAESELGPEFLPPTRMAKELGVNIRNATVERFKTIIGGRLKNFTKTFPEFKISPVFTVDAEGMLVFKDNFKIRFAPEHFGIDPAKLKEGQTVKIDLDSFDISTKLTKPQEKEVTFFTGKGVAPIKAKPKPKKKPLRDKDLQKVQAIKNRAQATGKDKKIGDVEVLGTTEDVPIVESPGTLGAGNTIPEIEASLKPKGKPTSSREIVHQMERDFGVPFRSRITHMMRKTLGHFEIKSKVIRQRDVRDLSTAVHELGHHLDHNFFGLIHKHPPEGATQELLDMGKALYGKRVPPGGYKSEGVAEYIRNWMTDNDAENKAPNFTKWFNKYLKDNPDIAKRLNRTRELITKWKAQGALARIDSQIVETDIIPGTVKERVENAIKKLETLFIDKFAPLRRLRDEVGASQLRPTEDPFEVATANANKAGAKAAFFALEGTTDLAGNITGPSLQEVLKPISGEYKTWRRWAFAARARLWYKLGINPGISKTDADFTFDLFKDRKGYQKALDGFTKWNHAGIDYMVEAGAMEKELGDAIKKRHTIYLPFKRAFKAGEVQLKFSPGKGFVETGAPIKKAVGSGRAIVEPIQKALQGMEAMISAAQKSQVALAMANLADRFPGIGKHIVRIPPPMVPTTFSAEQIKGDILKVAVQKLGLDPTEGNLLEVIDNWDEDITIFTKGFKFTGKENVISIVKDGKRLFYEISPDLFNTLKGLDKFTLPWYLDIWLGKANRALRLGATALNPEFALRNFIRDLQTFSFTTEFAKGSFFSGIKGVGQDVQTSVSGVAEKFGITIPKDKNVLRFQALGGELSSFVLQDKSGIKHLKSTVLASDGTKYIINTFLHPVDVARELVGITEAGVRIGEFSPALAEGERRFGKGTADASMFAINAAQSSTVNFSKSGSLMQIVNQVEPFSNVAIQGPLKLLQTFRKNPIRSIRRGVVGLTTSAVILWWFNKDKKWWKNLPIHEKGNYLYFENPKNPNEIFRFPVAFELGHVFQTLPVAALDAMYRKDPNKVKDMFEFSLKQGNPFGVTAAFGPVLDIARNKDFADRPIVPRSVEGKLPEDRFKAHTSQLMRLIGKKLKVSPAQLEFLINSYSGGMYGRIARLLSGKGDVEGSKSDLPVIGTLFLRDPFAPKQQIQDFYTRFDLLSQKNQSDKITRDEKREFLIRNKIARAISPQWKLLSASKTVKQRKEIYGRIETAIIKGDTAINR